MFRIGPRWLASASALFFSVTAFAAPSGRPCVLDRPDADVKAHFAEVTRTRVRELIPEKHSSSPIELFLKIRGELDEDLNTELENARVPYTFYVLYNKDKYVGLALGTNAVLGPGSPLQLFIFYNANGHIRNVYIQNTKSKNAAAFRSKFYREQFRKYSISQLPEYREVLPPVRLPTEEILREHHAFMRAVRYNILVVKHFYNSFRE